jgi:hypothetical protein
LFAHHAFLIHEERPDPLGLGHAFIAVKLALIPGSDVLWHLVEECAAALLGSGLPPE